jgi:hypothetical protein
MSLAENTDNLDETLITKVTGWRDELTSAEPPTPTPCVADFSAVENDPEGFLRAFRTAVEGDQAAGSVLYCGVLLIKYLRMFCRDFINFFSDPEVLATGLVGVFRVTEDSPTESGSGREMLCAWRIPICVLQGGAPRTMLLCPSDGDPAGGEGVVSVVAPKGALD